MTYSSVGNNSWYSGVLRASLLHAATSCTIVDKISERIRLREAVLQLARAWVKGQREECAGEMAHVLAREESVQQYLVI
ncbi:hypothetical protein Tco_0945362 [Tanacetum coccineum]